MRGIRRAAAIAVAAWAVIAGLHLWLNGDWPALRSTGRQDRLRFLVAYLPVT
jgi:hypothetical protein